MSNIFTPYKFSIENYGISVKHPVLEAKEIACFLNEMHILKIFTVIGEILVTAVIMFLLYSNRIESMA